MLTWIVCIVFALPKISSTAYCVDKSKENILCRMCYIVHWWYDEEWGLLTDEMGWEVRVIFLSCDGHSKAVSHIIQWTRVSTSVPPQSLSSTLYLVMWSVRLSVPQNVIYVDSTLLTIVRLISENWLWWRFENRLPRILKPVLGSSMWRISA